MAYTPQIYYPNSYGQQFQQQYQQPMIQPTQQPQQNNQGLIWVSGEIGAKSYLVAPNSTVMLMDSESSKFYIKSTDAAGMPTLRSYEYKECNSAVPQVIEQDNKYVTREEYNELLARIDDITKPKTQAKKKEVENE